MDYMSVISITLKVNCKMDKVHVDNVPNVKNEINQKNENKAAIGMYLLIKFVIPSKENDEQLSNLKNFYFLKYTSSC